MIHYCILDQLISLNHLSTIFSGSRENGGIHVVPTGLNGTLLTLISYNLTFIKIDEEAFPLLQQIMECQTCVHSPKSSCDMLGYNHLPPGLCWLKI